MADVFIDHKFIGTVAQPTEFVQNLIADRRAGKVQSSVNVQYDADTDNVYVEIAKGRSVRPLIVVKNGKPLLTPQHVDQLKSGETQWFELLKQGVIEFIDAAEEEMALVAIEEQDLTPEHTHLEISSIDILGIITALVPFGDYNQGARLLQGAKNQKQAMGFYAANYFVRMDMDTSILHYPQRPIVTTLLYDVLEYDKHPSGMNVTIAVMSYKGYNMEDAIVVNKGSIQRGFARSTYFRPTKAEELRYSGGLMDEISIPDKETRGYRSEEDYRFLEEDGIIGVESKVAEGDVVIGKTSPPRFLSGVDEYNLVTNYRRESSVSLKHGEKGTVDFIMLTENDEGNKLVQVRLRDDRTPEIGDKFISRHGQKGVIATIVPAADMPFSANGITPDILFSPHGIPSRMTVGHLIELVGGKVGALSARRIDGTMFNNENERDIREELATYGFQEDGTEVMYNGETGEELQVKIYLGNMYYLRLKHMVANKLQSRARGPIQLLTRQPTEGKAKEGGLRLGEMEKDTFVAHGASLLLKERFDSDKAIVPVCERSGLVGFYDGRKNNRAMSSIHGDESEMHNVEISYAFKLFLDELISLGIYPKIGVKRRF
ncbi:MAG: DNA-directed RNA polymerase subunit B [Candidatus Woesearchaeota archaeon]|nr:DNA-directed RNA polymerase subunit B [Candidatus Woesearchaeota archaeon]